MGSSGRRIWSGKVSTRWTPPVGLFTKGAETIAREVLHGHDGDLASSVSAINFYINRAGRNLSERDLARLRHARRIIQESARPRGADALGRMAANRPVMANDEMQVALGYLCGNCGGSGCPQCASPETLRRLSCTQCRGRGCSDCQKKNPRKSKSPEDRNPSEERVDVLCGCGWGQLAMPLSEIPDNCPLCGLEIGSAGDADEGEGAGYDGGFECDDCEEGQALDPDQTCGSCGRYRGPGTA